MPHWLSVLASMSGIWIMLGFVISAILYERIAGKKYRREDLFFSTDKRDKARVQKITYLLVMLGFFSGFVSVILRTPVSDPMFFVLLGVYGVIAMYFSWLTWQAASEQEHWDKVVKDT